MTKVDKQALMAMVQGLIRAEYSRSLAVNGLVRNTSEGVVGLQTPLKQSEFTQSDWTYVHDLTQERDALYIQIDAKLHEFTDR